MRISKKVLALVLSVTMVISAFASTSAFAAEDANANITEEVVQPGDINGYYMDVGFTYQLKMADKNGNADAGAYEWSAVDKMSNPDGVLSITKDGVVTPLKEGRALLAAKDTAGNLYYVRVSVFQPITDSSPRLLLNGTRSCIAGQQLTLTVSSTNGNAPSDFDVTTANSKIATVEKGKDNNGNPIVTVTTKAPGSVPITISAAGYIESKYNISVASIFLQGSPCTYVDKTTQLTAISGMTKLPCTWSSSDDGIATVDQNGLVTGKAVGNVVITAVTDGGASTQRTVYVGDKDKSTIAYSADHKNYTSLYLPVVSNQTRIDGTTRAISYEVLTSDLAQYANTDTLYVKVPYKADDYVFSVGWHGVSQSDEYYNNYSNEPISVSPEADGDSTILPISMKDSSAYTSFVIDAISKKPNGACISWEIDYSDNNTAKPGFIRNGTYASTNGDIAFAFDNNGNFYWGAAKRHITNKQYVDSYGFEYTESINFDMNNSLVDGIDCTVPEVNPTQCWLDNKPETADYSWYWDMNSSVPDYTDGRSGAICYLTGSTPTPVTPTSNTNDSSNNESTGSASNSPATGTASTANVTKDSSGSSTVTVTGVPDSAPSVSGSTSSFSVTVPSSLSAQAEAGATASNHAKAVIDLPDSTILDQLKNNSVKDVSVTLKAPSDVTYANQNNVDVTIKLDAAVLQAAKDAKKDITASVVDATTGRVAYSWTFQGADLDLIKDLNLAINTKTSTLDPSVRSVTSVPGVLLTMADNSNLPGTASVKVYVADQGYTAGQTLYLYYFNTSADQLEYADQSAYTVDANGYATVKINHCSKYILLPQKVKAVPTLKLDTGKRLSVKAGKTYMFKVTASKKPTFVCGNGSVYKVSFTGSKGSDYFFKVTAAGKAGSSAGFYINGEKSPRTVGTIIG